MGLNYWVNNNVKFMLNYQYNNNDRYANGKGNSLSGMTQPVSRPRITQAVKKGKGGADHSMVALQ